MASVVLSPAVRANLLALHETSALMDTTQQRLATGKRANSALDNPRNFFTAQALDTRAVALNALLDQIGQAQQTLHAADNGITALQKLVQSAKAIAEQAKQATGPIQTYAPISLVAAPQFPPQPATKITGFQDFSNMASSVQGLVIRVAGVPYTVTPANSGGLDQAVADINNSPGLGPAGAATASKDPSGRFLVLTSNSAATMTVDYAGVSWVYGLIEPDLVQAVPALDSTNSTFSPILCTISLYICTSRATTAPSPSRRRPSAR